MSAIRFCSAMILLLANGCIMILLLANGCIPALHVSIEKFSRVRIGDNLSAVDAIVGNWPVQLFILQSGDGTITRCLEYSVSGKGDRPTVELGCVFKDDRLSKVVQIPDEISGYYIPDHRFKCILDFDDQSALIRRIESLHALTPDEQRTLVNNQPESARPGGLLAAEEFAVICDYTILLPQFLVVSLFVTWQHDHWNPARLALGATISTADTTFGTPFESRVDSKGRQLRLFWPGGMAAPTLISFENGHAIRIVSGSLATPRDY